MGCYADINSDDNNVLWSLLYCVCVLVDGWAWTLLSVQRLGKLSSILRSVSGLVVVCSEVSKFVRKSKDTISQP